MVKCHRHYALFVVLGMRSGTRWHALRAWCLVQGKDEERAAEELLARLEMQDTAPPPIPRSPPADVTSVDGAVDSALTALQVCAALHVAHD